MYENITNDKMVTKPSHYQSETGLEVIDVIEAFTFDLKGIEATDTGNVLKYICRWKQKNGLQDLEKAMWYLQHLIDHVKLLEKENNEPCSHPNETEIEEAIEATNRAKDIYKSITTTMLVADMIKNFTENRKEYEFTNLTFCSCACAATALSQLIDICKDFKYATVSDLYDITAVPHGYRDCSYGWNEESLNKATIARNEKGNWYINFEPPFNINNEKENK